MITTRRSRRGRSALILLGCIAAIAYFAYHAVEGEHGLHKRGLLEQRVRLLEEELAMLTRERQRIEHDVGLITQRAQSQPDLLDEQARALLNFAHPEDIVVLRIKSGERD
jgi:cell division protein FtsB